jgi:hypothetical protein
MRRASHVILTMPRAESPNKEGEVDILQEPAISLFLYWPQTGSEGLPVLYPFVDCVWNVMAHVQKPDFFFSETVESIKSVVASVQSTTGSRGVRISGSNAGYTMFRGSVKSTGYLLHSPVSPSLPLPCVTVCHHISTGLYTFNVPHVCMACWSSRESLCVYKVNTILNMTVNLRNAVNSLRSDELQEPVISLFLRFSLYLFKETSCC